MPPAEARLWRPPDSAGVSHGSGYPGRLSRGSLRGLEVPEMVCYWCTNLAWVTI